MEYKKSLLEQKLEEQRDLAAEALENVQSTLSEEQLKEANEFIAHLDELLAECHKPVIPVAARGEYVLAQEMKRLKEEKSIH